MGLDRLAINQITTPAWSLAQAIEGYARLGVGGIGIWRDKLAECGVRRARSLLRDAGSWVPSLCKVGDLAHFSDLGPAAALDDCRQALDEAAEIGARAVVFVCGGTGPGHGDIRSSRQRVLETLQRVAPYARDTGVSIGIEPFHPMHAAERGCVNTLEQAHQLCERVGPECSVILDVFHCWWDPELDDYLAPPYLAGISSVQLCDWRVPTRHPVTDRAMVGEGAADVAGMVRRLEHNGYRGPYEIEIFSTEWWAREPAEVARICVDRYRELPVVSEAAGDTATFLPQSHRRPS